MGQEDRSFDGLIDRAVGRSIDRLVELIDAQIDVIEGMAHSYPSQKQFRDALLWVDEPRREQIAEALDDARNALQETKGKDTGIPAIRRRLIEIMKTVPYTPESWEAASRLGYPQSDN